MQVERAEIRWQQIRTNLARSYVASRVSITALDLSSQTHPMARHILSAITSCKNGEPYHPGRIAGSCMIVDPCFFCVSFEAE